MWCKVHKWAYNNIYAYAHSPAGEASGRPAAFAQIFGQKRNKGMNELLAVRVILDYCARFSEGGENSGKNSGKSRGRLDLCVFSYTEGYRQAEEDEGDGNVKVDYESFIVAMKNLR
eukprot:5292454-Alexandrium_andersonii.AAC.1